MKRRLRFIVPRRQTEPVDLGQYMHKGWLSPPLPGLVPNQLGEMNCSRCGAHWPTIWMAVIPPCNCYGPMLPTCTSVTTANTGGLA